MRLARIHLSSLDMLAIVSAKHLTDQDVSRRTAAVARLLVCGFLVAVGWGRDAISAPATSGPLPAALQKQTAIFEEKIAPIIQTYCIDCHAETAAAGGIVLDDALSATAQFSNLKAWQKAARTQRSAEMPPSDGLQPTPQERETLIGWVAETTNILDHLPPFDPGPLVFRRLTRRQYNQTMRDLFGIDFDVAARVGLTQDPRAFGYDSVATVLEIPPTQMEKYVAGADEMLDRVIAERALRQSWSATELSFEGLGEMPAAGDEPLPPPIETEASQRHLRVTAETSIAVDIPMAGAYRLALQGYAFNGVHWQNYQADVAIALAGKTKKVISFVAQQADKKDKSAKRPLEWSDSLIRLPRGPAELTLRYLNPAHGPKWSDTRFKYLVLRQVSLAGPVPASGVSVDQAAHDRVFVSPPGEDPAAAARETITRFAEQAFRRPLGDDEIERLMQLYALARNRGFGFERSIRPMLQAALLSPHFLFRIESQPHPTPPADSSPPQASQPSNTGVPLNDHALASRLSYFLWGTMPDDELRKLADAGRLSEPSILRAQAERMMDDPRVKHFLEDFAVQWLHLEELDHALPSEDHFPKFTATLRSSMRGEILRFFENLVAKNRPITDLLDSDYTYIDRDLALFYRMGHLKHGWREHAIDRRRRERGGLLGMAGILAMTSHVDRTSPTRRGQWVLDVMLGDPPPPPPANVEQINGQGDKSDAASFRELLAIHADESSSCAGCHRKMDPLGFALDRFNPIGRWERERNGRAIDASGELPDGRKVTGVEELRQHLLDQKDEFARNLTEQVMIYALGRDLDYYDRSSVTQVIERLQTQQYRTRELLLGVIESFPFRFRRASP